MALFGSSRSIKLYLTGDSTSLERALVKSEAKLKSFERVAGKKGTLNSTLLGGFSKGGAIVAGAGVAALAIKSVVDAAKNAQVILGQTSVAVDDAGLSWKQYSQEVQAASLRIAKSSAFDDETVLQSFSTFIRGQKNVQKSILLSELAADVARGRYTDLATATQLVNKAALGQIGALRRAGISIDKNATATEALIALQKAYGGAAAKYAGTAAGAQDKLRVSVENLKESIGGGLTPAVTLYANQAIVAVDATNRLAAALAKLNFGIPGGGSIGGALKDALFLGPNTLSAAFGGKGGKKNPAIKQPGIGDILQAEGIHDRPNINTRGTIRASLTPTGGGGRAGVVASLRNQFFDNAIARRLDRVQDIASLSGQISALKGIQATISAQIGKVKDTTRKLTLGDQVVEINRQINGLNDEITQSLKDKGQALKDAKKKTADALRAQAAAFKQQADDIKSAVLDAFDFKTQQIENKRALDDAKKELNLSRRIGGPEGIKNATRDFVDAQRATQRQALEAKTFRVSAGPHGPVNAVQVGSIVIYARTDNPKELAKLVLSEMGKAGKKSSGSSRGRRPGTNPIGL